MCDLGFLVFNLRFEVGFWEVFGRFFGFRNGCDSRFGFGSDLKRRMWFWVLVLV